MPQTDDLRLCHTWIDRAVVDRNNTRIGKLTEIYADDETGQPEWITAKTGLFGVRSSFVPLAGATAHGDDLKVPFDKDTVKASPTVAGDGHLSEEEEAELYRHYGRAYPGGVRAGGGRSDGYEAPRHPDPTSGPGAEPVGRVTGRSRQRGGSAGAAGTTYRPTGRPRLRKYAVTEAPETSRRQPGG